MTKNVSSASRQEMEDDDWPIPEQSESIKGLFTLANKHYKDKDYKKALEWYGIILERAEKTTDNDENAVYAFMKSLYMISRCHMETGNYDQAANIIEMVYGPVLSKCPDKIHIPEQLMIQIKERRGDLIGAFIFALIFKHLNPSNRHCEKLLSNIQEKVGDSFTESGFNIKVTFIALIKKGKQMYKEKEFSTAAAVFEKANEVFYFLPEENLQQAYIWLAKCFLMLENLDHAQSTIEKVLHRFPENSKARNVHEKIKEAKQAKYPKESPRPDLNKKTQQNDELNKVPDKKTEGKGKQTQQNDELNKVPDKKTEGKSKQTQQNDELNKVPARKTKGKGKQTQQNDELNKVPDKRTEGKGKQTQQNDELNKVPDKRTEGKGKQTQQNDELNKVPDKKTKGKNKKTSSTQEPVVSSANRNGMDSAWEGLPSATSTQDARTQRLNQQLPSSNKSSNSDRNRDVEPTCNESRSTSVTASTQQSHHRGSQASDFSVNTNNRYAMLRPISNDGSTGPQPASSNSPAVETEDIESKEGEPSSSDENAFQPVKSRKQRQNKKEVTERKAFCLPEGVEVICEHFESEDFAHPQKSSQIPKVCDRCQICPSRCKYAYWSKPQKKWIPKRPVPPNMRSADKLIRSCHHVQSGKTCYPTCTFAHGPELQLWDLERKGELPSPETYLKNKQMSLDGAATPATGSPRRVDGRTRNVQEHNDVLSGRLDDHTRHNLAIEVGGNRRPVQASRVQSSNAAGASNEYHLPKGVKIVCDDFLRNRKFSKQLNEQATYTCNLCKTKFEQRHSLFKYAFWSDGFKKWFEIRPFPKGVLCAVFRQCKDFENNKPCVKRVCTFAHGPEQSMWTMEREGKLVQPWEALNRVIVFESTNRLLAVVRPLPIGAVRADLRLCKSVHSGIICRFGRGCRFAHSEYELESWNKLYRARLEQVNTLDNKQSLKHHEIQCTDSVPGVEIRCSPENPNVQLAEDCDEHSHSWEFCVRFEAKLGPPSAELLSFHPYFRFTKIEVVGFDNSKKTTIILSQDLNTVHIPKELVPRATMVSMQMLEYRVTIAFKASLFGSFSQRLLLNFGRQPFLKKDFTIDIGSKETLERLADRRTTVNLDDLSWEDMNMKIVKSRPDPENEKLMSTYRLPSVERIVSAQLVSEGDMKPETYKQTMHQLLFAEEVYMRKLLLSLTPMTAVRLELMNTKPDLRFGGTKYAATGQLFGKIELDDIEITLDDMAGRVCLRNVNHIWIQSRDKPKIVYELPSEIHEGNTIYVDLAADVCEDLKLSNGKVVEVEMRFNINRHILCLMHKAVDSLGNTQAQQLFPVEQDIRRRKVSEYWSWFLDVRLNDCQKHVIQSIAEVVPPSPPLVVFGPFGTGKTFTLNQAVIYLMAEKANRVLLCTHTNSAADIHVELLDKYLNGKGVLLRSAKPLRIYNPEVEWSRTSDIARKYALLKDGGFLAPTRRDVIDHRVIITTLVTADLLTKLNVHHGFFTHILIDEAAQAWETEALIPLALAGPNTKIVFTGDHMQMSPEVYSEFTRQCGLQRSLPERLFDHYQYKDNNNEQVLFLFENYRSHEAILNFPSVNCYQNGIVAKGDVPRHPVLPPLLFYAAKGKDEKQSNNSFLNTSEVYEVVKRVDELVKKWPLCWGVKNLEEIAVVAPYKYQVDAIRGELRKNRMGSVNVQTIHNIQGREYRVLLISTVRTWNSIQDSDQSEKSFHDDLSLEFLSDPKLLITAVTRAKSLVAVVGDPFALCTLGRCKNLWNDYITRCYNGGGLIGVTWEELDKEISDHYAQIQLNPEAQEFVPTSQIPNKDQKEHSDVADTAGSTENETESLDDAISNPEETEPENEDDQASSCSGDVQDTIEDEDCSADVEDVLEDETVLPVDIDAIIKALCKFVKQRQQKTSSFDQEFPPLTKGSSKVKIAPVWPTQKPVNLKALKSEYRICNKNGRTEIQLLDIHDRQSDRVQQIVRDNYKGQNLEPEVLLHLLEKDNDPVKFYAGQLQIRNEKSRPAYLVIPDKAKPDIRVKGSIRHAFDHDTVVVEILQPSQNHTESISSGFLKGVLNQLISPRERQYVCKVDRTNPALMLPINRSVTNIVNLSDKSLKDVIPIYKKPTTNDKKVLKPMKMITVEEVLEKNLLFVVEFLQWRSDCSLPLGIAVRTLPTGETVEQCKQILFAECGIRKAFSKNTKDVIRNNFSSKWEIPESEKDRKKIHHAFTIDPPESRDLDDAISIDGMGGDGQIKVGIHIADVSFVVQRGTALDREARQRGVSYYPDGEEMIPMLPRELSEDILSLLPNEDRLTVSVFVTLNSQGEIDGQAEILRTVTRSCCRLSYSQAQQIIDMEEHGEVEGVPDQVRRDIRTLHSLAEKRRMHRLSDASFDHSNNREDADAHELIEELMILANNTVGDFLHRGNPKATPLRTQLEPKVHRLNEWAETHGSFAKYSPALQAKLHSEDIKEEIKEKINVEENDIDIQGHVWEEIRRAAESGNVKKAERLICNPLSSPQLEITRLHLMRIQTRSQYTCSESDTEHYSLGMSNYTHFTSPIRRYIDIEVHRLLVSMIPSNGANVEQHRLNEEEMAMLCRRSTYFKENADKFEKGFKRIQFASALKEKNEVGMFFIDQLEDRFFTIHPVSPEHDRFLGKHKRIKFDDLLPSSKSDADGKPQTTLTWKSRIYIVHQSEIEASDTTRFEDAATIKKMVNSGRNLGALQTIPGKIWMAIIEAIKNGKPITNLLGQVKGTGRKEETTRERLSTYSRSSSRDVYRHPNFGQTDDGKHSNGDGDLHEIKLNLKQFGMVRFQMFSHLHQKILCPDVQLLKLSSGFSICLEHQRYPLSCFAFSAKRFASKAEYESIDKYVGLWKPVLAMEAAHGAVAQNDGFVLKSLQVKWKQKDGTTKGKFTLTSSYCDSRQLHFNYGDLACIRIPLSPCPEDSDTATSHEEESIWIGHCVVNGIKQNKGQNKETVTIRLHQMSCKLPPQLLTTVPQTCDMEYIYQPLPLRRMIAALECNLDNSSELVRTICLGQSPPQDQFPLPNQELSLHAHYKTAGFQQLNKYQENAVKNALTTPFSLIQGPPGTGKTVTGVHIAYWFTRQNEKHKPTVFPKQSKKTRKKVARPITDQGEEKNDQVPLQVLYCGPSNKSVDVVTEYLLKIPMMKEKILRVYGKLIEEAEYPIPNKVGFKPKMSEDELKIPVGKVKEVSLHHYIRSNVSPFAARLKELEEEFKEAKRQKEKASEESVKEYCEIISEAEKWAIQRSGKEIILCTCSRAGSPMITNLCNIRQCIIDECGMCMEPEALVPMTSSNAKQFVLIGDHKQLQPIITNDRAKKLGLDVSMFERLAKQAFMLQIQYRMHASICEFPSQQFYEGKLKTSDIVKSRQTANVRIWPAKDIKVSFCHIEGEEKSTAIATADSGVDSKYNMDEATKVVYIAKYLVNNHRREILDKNIVILTPYRQQRKVIQDLLKKDGRDILVTTIIKSQGSEWDYVILSLVRSLPQQELEPEPSLSWLTEHLGFITDDHQVNVALTRAKHGLIIIGNKNLLSYDPNWRNLIQHCEDKKCMVDKSWPSYM